MEEELLVINNVGLVTDNLDLYKSQHISSNAKKLLVERDDCHGFTNRFTSL